MATNRQRGSALLEALPISVLLVGFCSMMLLGGYAMFARVWMQYQSEQALYCAVQERLSSHCRRQLDERLREFLFWGEVSSRLTGGENNWRVEVQWKYQKLEFRVQRKLDLKSIVDVRALRS